MGCAGSSEKKVQKNKPESRKPISQKPAGQHVANQEPQNFTEQADKVQRETTRVRFNKMQKMMPMKLKGLRKFIRSKSENIDKKLCLKH